MTTKNQPTSLEIAAAAAVMLSYRESAVKFQTAKAAWLKHLDAEPAAPSDLDWLWENGEWSDWDKRRNDLFNAYLEASDEVLRFRQMFAPLFAIKEAVA